MSQLRLTCTFYAECAQPEGCGIAAFGGDEYIVSVTGPASVYPLLHDEEQDPPLPADWYLWVLRSLTTCTEILHCVQNDGAGRKGAAGDRGTSWIRR